MYNRYIPNGTAYTRVVEEDAPPFRQPEPEEPERSTTAEDQRADAADRDTSAAAPPPVEGKKTGLAGLLHSLKLDTLDTGDILLLLILLFLFLEGDDMELIITLGLLLLLGLD